MQGVLAFIGLVALAALVSLLVLPASFLYAIPALFVIALLVWAMALGARPAVERMEASEEPEEDEQANAPMGVRASGQQ